MTSFVNDFLGYKFIWFIGEVEDRNDPLKLGRVKVRCFGWHSTDKDVQPTEQLPWASTVQPVTAPAASASGLTIGTWVLGFFLDGEAGQRPTVIGQIPGYRFDDKGANGESELPRAARAENDYPSPQSVLRKVLREISITKDLSSDQLWSEPEEPLDALYPFVQTLASESGILTQLVNRTDTGESRKTDYHPSGTYQEITTQGDNVAKITGNNYTIVAKDDHVYIKGNVYLTVDADCTTNIKGNWKINVDGDKEENIGGDHRIFVEGQINQTAASHAIDLGTGSIDTAGTISTTETITGDTVVATSAMYTPTLKTSAAGTVNIMSHKHTETGSVTTVPIP